MPRPVVRCSFISKNQFAAAAADDDDDNGEERSDDISDRSEHFLHGYVGSHSTKFAFLSELCKFSCLEYTYGIHTWSRNLTLYTILLRKFQGAG